MQRGITRAGRKRRSIARCAGKAGFRILLGHFASLAIGDLEGAGSPLISAHADLHARWSADRSKRVSGATDLEFSDAFIADRAQMLQFLMLGNTNDTAAFPSNLVADQVLYRDLALRPVAGTSGGKPTEVNVFLTGGTPNPRGPNTRVIGFGPDSSDALQGRDNADRLYGGRGADILKGGKGDDYLEGGEGMDTYVYLAETSLLQSNWNDGNDEVRATDGQGTILYTFTGSGGDVNTIHKRLTNPTNGSASNNQ